jgi:hypothetical protein
MLRPNWCPERIRRVTAKLSFEFESIDRTSGGGGTGKSLSLSAVSRFRLKELELLPSPRLTNSNNV